MKSVVQAVYEIETTEDIGQLAAEIAGEQSSGTFVALARETAELRSRHSAEVVKIEEIELSGHSPLPGATGDWAQAKRARVAIDFPLENFGASIPNLMAAVAGNLFEITKAGAIRLVDLDLPCDFARRYPGPQFGWEGTLERMTTESGPLLGTIVKPSIGLGPDALGELVTELARAGIDFIKDDELQGNPEYFPFAERVRVVTGALDRVADETGHRPMYAFNITDDVERMVANHDLVRTHGGTCVMVTVNAVGYSSLSYLRERCDLPIHGHRAMIGAYARSPQVGIDFCVFQKLARLSGADHIHTNGLRNKFYGSDEEILAAINAVRTPLLGGYGAVPVLSSGQTPDLAHETYARVGADELLVLAGGGIHGHPGGSAAGVRAMRAAWDAALEGVDLKVRAAEVPELAAALTKFRPTATMAS
ncbi:RuBisCO large subunit C-terminal-like domain-containing protein [Brevibacterium oceani]|uniref:RuBisCO large subunit C-terminal-like domain-containing protein n=1 Tax=Brevibacterium oceani TaxID=358099 RepID=UPI001B3296C2|nr:RuBisCO large subunit C-terminal-like domain-containing protein [Brevibacterium oceani]